MPRPKTPPNLVKCSLWRIVKMVVQSVYGISGRHSEGIASFVQVIPANLANEYTKQLMEEASQYADRFLEPISLRDAVHPRCTAVQLRGHSMSVMVRRQLLDHLDVMTKLTHLTVMDDFGNSENRDDLFVHFKVTKHVHRLSHLRILRLGEVSFGDLIEGLAKHCPKLQEFAFVWAFETRPTSSCWDTFRSVAVTYHGTCDDDVMFMLENIPRLHYLNIYEKVFLRVFPRFRGPYQLQELNLTLEGRREMVVTAHGPEQLRNLVSHFPLLLKMMVVLTSDLTPMNVMTNLKFLTIVFPPMKSAISLSETCFSNLTSLTLHSVSNLHASLEMAQELPNLSVLFMYSCTGLDLYQVGTLFPNLSDLHIISCSPSRLTPKGECKAPFEHLQVLIFDDNDQAFSWSHLDCLLRNCLDLQYLQITKESHFDDADFLRMLRTNPFTHLSSMRLESDCLTICVVHLAIQHFGVELSEMHLNSSLMLDLSENLASQVEEMVAPFHPFLTINGVAFGDIDLMQ